MQCAALTGMSLLLGILLFGLGCSESAEIAVTKEEFLTLKQDVQDLTEEFRQFMPLMSDIHRNELAELRESTAYSAPADNLLNDTTIEERVTILEFQVESLNDNVMLLNSGVADLGEEIDVIDGEIAVIFADQVLQDERILELEGDADDFAESINSLESTDEYLESAMMSVNVTLSLTMQDVVELQVDVADLDEKVSALEQDGSFAFHVNLIEATIPDASVIIFSDVKLNLGDGYNAETGEFTVPSGGAGLYYFYVHALVQQTELAGLQIRKNNVRACRAYGRDFDTYSSATCAMATTLTEGDVVHVYLDSSTDDTPFYIGSESHHNTFTGIRIAPQ